MQLTYLALITHLQAGKSLSLTNIQHFMPPHWAQNLLEQATEIFHLKKKHTKKQNTTKTLTTHRNHSLWQVILFSHLVQPTTSHLLSPSWPFTKPAYSGHSDLSLRHDQTILQSYWPSGCSLRLLMNQNLQQVQFLPCSKESLKT